MAETILPGSAPTTHAGNGQPVTAGVMPLFSTWIWLCKEGPTYLNERLEDLARQLMCDERNASRRTNCGGWHYAGDLFKVNQSVVTEFRHEIQQHVQAFLNYFRKDGRNKEYAFRLEGWINVNGVGDHN